MPPPLLTIAIPTFNRAGFLVETLKAFSRETDRIPAAGVGFLIIDNGSTDETAEVVSRFSETRSDVTYMRNGTNIGAERNIMSCALKSPGTFTWIFGDDDLPSPGSVAKILENLERDQATDLYFLNYLQMNQGLSKVVCPSVLNETADAALSSIREFYGYLGSADVIGFISSVVFRTGLIRNASFGTYVGFGSYYGHFGALIEGFHQARCRYFGFPMVIQRQGNQRTEAAEGALADTFKGEVSVFLGFLRIVDRLLRIGALTPEDLDTITAKRSFEATPIAGCVCLLEWWTERVLRDPLIASLAGPRSAAFDEAFDQTHRLVSTQNFGTATGRMREILDLAQSIRAGRPPPS